MAHRRLVLVLPRLYGVGRFSMEQFIIATSTGMLLAADAPSLRSLLPSPPSRPPSWPSLSVLLLDEPDSHAWSDPSTTGFLPEAATVAMALTLGETAPSSASPALLGPAACGWRLVGAGASVGSAAWVEMMVELA